jgi:hypothetical protein
METMIFLHSPDGIHRPTGSILRIRWGEGGPAIAGPDEVFRKSGNNQASRISRHSPFNLQPTTLNQLCFSTAA